MLPIYCRAPLILTSALYPVTDGANFDHEYSNATHIPLAMEIWGVDASHVEVEKRVDGPYECITRFRFADMEALGAALGAARTPELTNGVVNFTTITPVFQISEVQERLRDNPGHRTRHTPDRATPLATRARVAVRSVRNTLCRAMPVARSPRGGRRSWRPHFGDVRRARSARFTQGSSCEGLRVDPRLHRGARPHRYDLATAHGNHAPRSLPELLSVETDVRNTTPLVQVSLPSPTTDTAEQGAT